MNVEQLRISEHASSLFVFPATMANRYRTGQTLYGRVTLAERIWAVVAVLKAREFQLLSMKF